MKIIHHIYCSDWGTLMSYTDYYREKKEMGHRIHTLGFASATELNHAEVVHLRRTQKSAKFETYHLDLTICMVGWVKKPKRMESNRTNRTKTDSNHLVKDFFQTESKTNVFL